MKQEEYETRFYEKQARRPIAVNTQNNTPKTPEGAKPVVDSRDAMEQKKDRAWGKIETTYNPYKFGLPSGQLRFSDEE